MLSNNMIINGVEYLIGRINMYRIQYDADGTEHMQSERMDAMVYMIRDDAPDDIVLAPDDIREYVADHTGYGTVERHELMRDIYESLVGTHCTSYKYNL